MNRAMLRLDFLRLYATEEEAAGLVHEYAQFLLTVTFHLPHKRKRRKLLPATSTGTFPRIQVVPVFRPSPTYMVPNFSAWRKGASRAKIANWRIETRKAG